MQDWLDSLTTHDVPFVELVARLLLAFVLGFAVAAIYWLTHRRDSAPAPGMTSTLVLLAILIAVVTMVIGHNVARAFSLAGVLAIVRFRTVMEDTRDTAFVIFAVVIGMAVGAGYPVAALSGLAVAGTAAFVARPRFANNLDRWGLNVRVAPGIAPEAPLEEVFRKHLDDFRLTATTTSRQGSALDLTYQVRLRPAASASVFVAELNLLAGLQNVELRKL
jgi:hypothetical protein